MRQPNWPIEIRVMENGQKGVFATKTIKQGERIGYFYGKVVPQPNMYTITDAKGCYIESTGPLGFLNHRCGDANARLDDRTLCANTDIKEGDQVMIDYRLTERSFASPFDCNCGSPSCCRRLDTKEAERFSRTQEKRR